MTLCRLLLLPVFLVVFLFTQNGNAASGTPDPALIDAAKNGDSQAMVYLGDFYRDRNGGEGDVNKAYEYYSKASADQNVDGYMRMGWVFDNGFGVEQNKKVAIEWYQKAADNGHHGAQYNLGLIYEFGKGTTKDISKAIKLYEKASKHPTYQWPQFRLGSIFEKGIGVPKDEKKAADWFFIAGSRGHVESQYRLGLVLESKAKNRKRLENALQWFESAAKGGNKDAPNAVKRIQAKLSKPEPELKKTFPDIYPPKGPMQTYKGYTLIGSTYKNANNDEFFKWMKWAIDITQELPAKLKKYPEYIKEVRYDPPSKQRPKNDAYTNIVGVYSIGPNDTYPAPIIIYKDVRWGAPIQFAYSLAGNGMRAARHKERLQLAEKLSQHNSNIKKMSANELKKVQRKHYELTAALKKTDLKIVEAYECEPMLYQYELNKLWETDSRRIDAISRELSLRGCF